MIGRTPESLAIASRQEQFIQNGEKIMVKVFLLSTGNEIVSGEHADTNLEFLRTELQNLGFTIIGLMTVPDDARMLTEAALTAAKTAELLIMTGGLGPTFDDLTRTQITEAFHGVLEQRPSELEKIKAYFTAGGRNMPANNISQAYFPQGALVLPNPNGTAAGIYWTVNEGRLKIAMLPGPPGEMRPMFKEHLLPLLQRDFSNNCQLVRQVYKISGISESRLEERLEQIWAPYPRVQKSIRAGAGEIELVLQTEQADTDWEQLQTRLQEQLAAYIFGYAQDTLLSVCADLLRQQQLRVAVAESCTGGLIMGKFTDLPNSSDYFWGGVVSYSNQAKRTFLQVPADILASCGAVSPETAEAMLQGIMAASGSDIGIAVTGIAGPGGGSQDKPVGLVYVAVGGRQDFTVKKCYFSGNRQQIRERTLYTALNLLRQYLLARARRLRAGEF